MDAQLYKNLTGILMDKTESEVKEYINAHLSEFPESVREDIVLGFFEESLLTLVEGGKAVDDFRENGLKIAEDLIRQKGLLATS